MGLLRVMTKIDEFGSRLLAAGYSVTCDVPCGCEESIALAAAKMSFSWKGLVVLSHHVVIRELAQPTVQDFYDLFEVGFKLGKSSRRIPWLRGMQFGYVIIPVVVAEVVSDEVREYVCKAPVNRWCLFEFPVIYDLRTADACCFQDTNLWGAFFFPELRGVVRHCIK